MDRVSHVDGNEGVSAQISLSSNEENGCNPRGAEGALIASFL